MGRLFGTDGVRGVANKELTPELAFNLGKAGTYVLKAKNKRPVVVIGKDTRISCLRILAAAVAPPATPPTIITFILFFHLS